MPPEQFMVRLQHGIVGGFAPPTPNAIHQLVRSPDDPSNLSIQSMVRPQGESSLTEHPAKAVPVGAPDHTSSQLVEELHSILKEIPTEQPPGSEDIYGMNTSIFWGSDDLEWQNQAPQGCTGGTSDVQPTPQQKEKFKRAVEIVNELTRLEN